MIDIGLLAHGLTTFIAPFLPQLIKPILEKVGEGAAEETGKKLADGASSAVKALWNRLKPKVEANSHALVAVQDVANKPDNLKLQTVLEVQLEKLLSEDQAFATEVEQLFNKAKEVAGSQVSATHGGIAFGDNAEGNVAFTGGVQGDFVMGNKQTK